MKISARKRYNNISKWISLTDLLDDDLIPEEEKELCKRVYIRHKHCILDNKRLGEEIQIDLPSNIYQLFLENKSIKIELEEINEETYFEDWYITSKENTIEYVIPLTRSNTYTKKDYTLFIKKTRIYTKLSFIKKTISNFILNNNLKKVIEYNDYNDLLNKLDNTDLRYFKTFQIEIILNGPELEKEEQEYIQEKLGKIKISYEVKETSNENTIINDTIDKIYAMLDTGVYEDKEEIKKQIEVLVSNYNDKIKTMDNNNFSYQYEKLRLELELIINKLSRRINNKLEYLEMLILLNKYMNIIENTDEESNHPKTDIELYIWRIVKEILPHINNKAKLEELKNIINNERNIIISYIKGNNNSKAEYYNTCENFILIFRKLLQKYLYSLKIELDSQDAVKDFIKTFPQIIEKEKLKNKNEEIEFLMSEIQNNSQIIQKKGTKKDNEDLQKIINKIEISENNSLEKTIEIITEILKYTLKILLRIEKREQKYNNIDKYTINIKRRKKNE